MSLDYSAHRSPDHPRPCRFAEPPVVARKFFEDLLQFRYPPRLPLSVTYPLPGFWLQLESPILLGEYLRYRAGCKHFRWPVIDGTSEAFIVNPFGPDGPSQ